MAPTVDDMTLPALTHRPAVAVADRVRRLAELLTTPLLPAEYLDLVSPFRTGADLRGRIIEIRRETPDAVTLVIRPGRGWRGHRPGQYVRIGVDVDGVRNWRAYSLTGLASTSKASVTWPTPKTSKALIPDGCISVTVKAIPDGKVSNHLVHNAAAGTMIMLDQAAGDFTLPDPIRARFCSSPQEVASRP
jgi:stearoyl-CoA 9-desaturase NADPH oxidoreductase